MKILSLILLFSTLAFASIGQITALKGSGTLLRDTKTLNLSTGFKLEEKDIVSTSEKSKAQIIFNDGTIVTIGKKSQLNIAEYLFDDKAPKKSKTNFKFMKGAFKSITGKIGKVAPDRFKLATKTATIGIRGTTLVGDQKQVACTQGTITVSSNGVTQVVPAGMIVTTPKNAPPTAPKPYKAGSLAIDNGDEEEKSDEKEKDKEEKSDEKEKDKEEKSDEKEKSSDKKSDEQKSDEKQADEQKSDDKQADKQQADDKKSDNMKIDEKEKTENTQESNTDNQNAKTETNSESVNETQIANDSTEQAPASNDAPTMPPASDDVTVGDVLAPENMDAPISIGENNIPLVDIETPTIEMPVIEVDIVSIVEAVAEVAIIAVNVADDVKEIVQEQVTVEQAEESIVEDPIVEEPIVEDPVVEEPIVEDPVVEEPIVEDPIIVDPIITTNLLPNTSDTISSSITTTSALDLTTDTQTLDYLDFGYWQSSDLTDSGVYVNGVVTPSEIIDSLMIPSQATMNYTGKIAANVSDLTGESVQSGGTIDLAVDFANNDITGNINITEGNWQANINSGEITRYGISSSDISSAATSSVPDITGNMDGNFYGVDAGAVGGTVDLSSATSGSVSGAYGATNVQP